MIAIFGPTPRSLPKGERRSGVLEQTLRRRVPSASCEVHGRRGIGQLACPRWASGPLVGAGDPLQGPAIPGAASRLPLFEKLWADTLGVAKVAVFDNCPRFAFKAHLDAIDKGFAGLGLVKFCGKHIHNITVDGLTVNGNFTDSEIGKE